MASTKKKGRALVIMKNLLSASLGQDAAGFAAQGDPFRIRHGDALAYARACRDPNPKFAQGSPSLAHPLFASRLFMEVLEATILFPELRMNVLRMVHAEQTLVFCRGLEVGMELFPRATISAVRTVSTGQIVDIDLDARQGDDLVISGRSSMFLRQKTSGSGKKARKEVPAPVGKAAGTFSIEPGQPREYADASHDYNPVHTRPVVARLAGFKRPIAHGLCVLAMTTTHLVARFAGSDPARLARLSVRFARPAYPGEELTVFASAGEAGYAFEVRNSKGIPVLSQGEAGFR